MQVGGVGGNSRGGGKERERENMNLKQAPGLVWSPTQGFIPQVWGHDLNQKQTHSAS